MKNPIDAHCCVAPWTHIRNGQEATAKPSGKVLAARNKV